jgi:5-dehydro-2-deoxygluconokinase
MFELLVPPEKAQLDRLKGEEELSSRDTGAESGCVQSQRSRSPRGLRDDRPLSGGHHKVGCISLGRSEDDRKVLEWLGMAASVPGFIAFADDRTVSRSAGFRSAQAGEARAGCR